MEKWEYLSQFVYADAEKQKDFLRKRFPDTPKPSKFSPRSLMPALDELGEQGWELVHMQPVYVGDKGDVLTHVDTSGGNRWTNAYFCAFKRRKA